MIDSKTTIGQFVLSVPQCHYSSTLDAWVNSLSDFSCPFLVLVDSAGKPHGVVLTTDILLLVAKQSFQNKSQLKRISYRHCKKLVTKATVLNEGIAVSSFLANHNSSASGNYLLVDSTGILVGALDLNRLLQMVCLQGNCYQPDAPQSELIFPKLNASSSVGNRSHKGKQRATALAEVREKCLLDNRFTTLLRSLDVPLQIETATGEICFQNLAWQELASPKPQYYLPLLQKSQGYYLSSEPDYYLAIASPQEDETAATSQETTTATAKKLQQLYEELIVGISHDLRSPLTVVIGLANLLKEEKVGSLNLKQKDYSETIYYSGKKLANLIDSFFNVTKLINQQQPQRTEIEVKSLCEQIYHEVRDKLTIFAALRKREPTEIAELQLDITPGVKPIAMANLAYLEQILSCLIEIALQFSSDKELFGISIEQWSNWLAVVVWNEGGGFSESQQQFISRQLEDTSNQPNSHEKKQALSLMLAQQLARFQGGEISFISQPNYGSEFVLLLPRKAENLQPVKNTLVSIVATKAKRIIEMSEKIRSLGYYPTIARSKEEAITQANTLQPFKIIIDSESAECNTEDSLLERLRSEPQTAAIPLVLLEESSAIARSYGNITSLSYPINRATLAKLFPPVDPQRSYLSSSLTVLRLSLAGISNSSDRALAFDFVFESLSSSLSHHIIQADSLEQAELLAQIWDIDVTIWDGATITNPEPCLQSLAKRKDVASIPLITLDKETTAIANKISALTVFPCLLPEKERSIQKLTEVIQIAAGFG